MTDYAQPLVHRYGPEVSGEEDFREGEGSVGRHDILNRLFGDKGNGLRIARAVVVVDVIQRVLLSQADNQKVTVLAAIKTDSMSANNPRWIFRCCRGYERG